MRLLKFVLIILTYQISSIVFGQVSQEYKNSEYSYSIIFPKDWKYYEAKEYYHIVRCELRESDSLASVADGQISVMVVKSGNEANQGEVLKQNMKIINMMGKNIQEINKEEKEINGNKALYHVYTYNWKKEDLADRRIDVKYYLQKNNLQYIVSYSGKEEIYNKYKDNINNSLLSFKLFGN
jgi:hypothetical protein